MNAIAMLRDSFIFASSFLTTIDRGGKDMIVNNFNGPDLEYKQTGTGSTESRGGKLQPGQYQSFSPAGSAPYTVALNVSNGFTVTGIESPDAMVSFLNQGSSTEKRVTNKVG
jgi:hypothetical protein